MLLSFGARNFWSFREGVEVSLRLNAHCPRDISMGKDHTDILCIKGANASGKTNVARILSYLSFFCTNSWSKKPEDRNHIQPFFDSGDDTDLFIEWRSINGLEYRYDLSLNANHIVRERLTKKKNRTTVVFERNNDELTNVRSQFSGMKKMKLRKNASVISTSRQYEFEPLKEIYDFFNNIISNVTYIGWADRPLRSAKAIREQSLLFAKAPDAFNFVKEFLVKVDLGIDGVDLMKKTSASALDEEKEDEYEPVFHHKVDGRRHPLDFHSESSGTKSLYMMLHMYFATLALGGVLCLDEFDNCLHPHILPKLMELFTNTRYNKHGAQFIFTTNNSEVINESGKYRTFIVNKRDNESFGYRADEIPGNIIRNDRSMLKVYNSGKIGGVPVL